MKAFTLWFIFTLVGIVSGWSYVFPKSPGSSASSLGPTSDPSQEESVDQLKNLRNATEDNKR